MELTEPMKPENAVQAVVHPNPYPYYAELRAGPTLLRDERLGAWMAATAAVVTAVLENSNCRVRPEGQRAPPALVGTPAGDVFARLVRMNDGARHQKPRQALQRALAGVDLAAAGAVADRLARATSACNACDWTSWTYDVPVATVAHLLGFADTQLPQVVRWTRDFVACLSPLSSSAELAAASAAAYALLQRFGAMVQGAEAMAGTLVAAVCEHARSTGWEDADALLANLIGFLSQSCDATAGLIGNALVVLVSRVDLREALLQAPDTLGLFIDEVSRFDPPIQNTRRFVAADTRIGDIAVREGDTILVLLASASRDPQANIAPDEFLIERSERRLFGFGHGVHVCPGQALARAIAIAAVRAFLLERLHPMPIGWTYRPSVNARIPDFYCNQGAVP